MFHKDIPHHMKKLIQFIIVVLLYSLEVKATSLEVFNIKQLTKLPSASASTYVNSTLYAVGDDSPSLYSLDLDFNIVDETSIRNGQPNEHGRIPSNQKADLEGSDLFIINGSPTLVMVGSGTYTDTREKALLYSLENKTVSWKNVRPFYRSLRKFAHLNKNEFINIEGLASNEFLVFLLSRGSHGPNLIFSFKKNDFISYISGEAKQIETVGVQKVKLPSIENSEATLSGATWHAPSQKLIITASVDANNNGKILGSFISHIGLDELAIDRPIDLSSTSYRINHNKSPLISKVESVVVSNSSDNLIMGILTADNDDGTSQFMQFKMQLE